MEKLTPEQENELRWYYYTQEVALQEAANESES